MEDNRTRSAIGIEVHNFVELRIPLLFGRRNFLVVERILNRNRSNAPSYEIVSRHWTVGGAERRARRRNEAQAALEVFRSRGR